MTNQQVQKKDAFIVRWEKEEAKGIYHLVSGMQDWLMDILRIHNLSAGLSALVFTALCFVPSAGMTLCCIPALMSGVSLCFGLWASSKTCLVLAVIKSLDLQRLRGK